MPRGTPRAVGWWLIALCAMVAVMVMLGGYTRLTHSGLSMVHWRPNTFLPPTSHAAWQAAFDDYRRSPEFLKVNSGMDLAGFKDIYYPEYLHRLWGRLFGLALLVPLAWLLVRRTLPRPLRLRLLGVLALAGLQGVIGWLMVASGLVDRPEVSHYRLALHLLAAFAIYAWMLWLAAGILRPGRSRPAGPADVAALWRLRRPVAAVAALAVVTATWGAFVAGLDAGFIYNRFPLMGDRPWPTVVGGGGSAALAPLQDPGFVQFTHRVLATTTTALALWLVVALLRSPLPRTTRRVVALVPAAVALQFALGVSTLLLVVPTGLAMAHQMGALVLLSTAIVALNELRVVRDVPIWRGFLTIRPTNRHFFERPSHEDEIVRGQLT